MGLEQGDNSAAGDKGCDIVKVALARFANG